MKKIAMLVLTALSILGVSAIAYAQLGGTMLPLGANAVSIVVPSSTLTIGGNAMTLGGGRAGQ